MRAAIVIAALVPLLAQAAIIDRIAVRVGKSVITESEIETSIRSTAFFNNEPPDFSPESRRKAADRLIDQKLIREELELSGYPPVTDAEVDEVFDQFKPRIEAARKAGFTEADLRQRIRWTVTAMRFLSLRFRAGLQVTDTQINEYFDEEIAPELRRKDPSRTYTADEYREQIEQILIERRVNQLSDDWTKTMRERTFIEFKEEAFQ